VSTAPSHSTGDINLMGGADLLELGIKQVWKFLLLVRNA
jgi:hypothetical protein